MLKSEVWKWVHKLPGFEGVKPAYEVSNLGSIRSWLDSRGRIKKIDPKILTGQMNGYPHVGLRRIDGGSIGAHVHSIVALAFIGPRPKGASIRHSNDDRTDNRVSNLVYGTHQENAIDRVRNQKSPAKVTESDVREIRERANRGESYGSISGDYPLSPGSIQRIAMGISFAYLNDKFPPLPHQRRPPPPYIAPFDHRSRYSARDRFSGVDQDEDPLEFKENGEIWKAISEEFLRNRGVNPIPFPAKYYVSSHGKVQSSRRHELKPQLVRGYVYYQLGFGGKLKFCQAHQLVAWTFIGPPPEGTDRIRHIDGNPKNNSFKNLAWGNAASNAADVHPDKRGTRTPAHRILEDEALKLKKMGHTKKEIRKQLGISARRAHYLLKNAEEREWERIEQKLEKRWQSLTSGEHTNSDNR